MLLGVRLNVEFLVQRFCTPLLASLKTKRQFCGKYYFSPWLGQPDDSCHWMLSPHSRSVLVTGQICGIQLLLLVLATLED